MSDGLDIHHGGAIAVDTEALRDVAGRMLAVATHYREARSAIGSAHASVAADPGLRPLVDLDGLWASGQHVAELRAEVEEASAGTFLMADAFEVVELRAEARALEITGGPGAADVQARLDRLLASDERLGPMADYLDAGWRGGRFAGLDAQFDLSGQLPQVFSAGGLIGATAGLGKLLPGMTLKGRAEPVTVTAVHRSDSATPPESLAGALRAMPSSGGAQIAVEKLVMPSGETRFVAYIKGTQAGMPGPGDDHEPWDMTSNLQLYTGRMSESYQATLDALAAAGAEPGDRVDVVGHSQGGMIGSHLAMESDFEVGVLITAGSPTEPTLDDDQLLVQMSHTDDVVRSLAGGGSPDGTGSPDSFTASRIGSPGRWIDDFWLATHSLDTYVETAEMVDDSADPRAVALDDYWAELGSAVSVERTEYRAERSDTR
ncbi:hypothetical protein [Microbacterium sp. 179-I 3D3 NHS]|uniref:hypothetical protein n=1 Tax=Microbacterium sp. 179-I 3D3 NHS TaxID=3142382 RepID=UPI0039A0EA8B